MSVLVRGMEMQKRCIDCPFMVSRDNDDCILQSDEANAKFDSWDDMKASCPLVEIPTTHGRLIDADELVRIWKGAMFSGDIKPIVDARPTVIEAEGSET